jgi:hypothetical protein
MKANPVLSFACAAASVALGGCISDRARVTATNPNQPGPAMGQTLGAGVGAVAGNVAGGAVGFVEGTAGAARKSFDSTRRVVRVWHSETTPDGRIVQVPEDIEVDAYGRPLKK